MQFYVSSYYLIPTWSEWFPQHPVLEHPQVRQCQRLNFTPIQTTGKNIILYIMLLWRLNSVGTILQWNAVVDTHSEGTHAYVAR
jgi:hypothetical protein